MAIAAVKQTMLKAPASGRTNARMKDSPKFASGLIKLAAQRNTFTNEAGN
jgi:hypothetical protein